MVDTPPVDSLLDTDFYKLLMAAFIRRRHAGIRVTYSIINRSRRVPLAGIVDAGALREALDHVRRLTLGASEAAYLRGGVFYGERGLFDDGFVGWLSTVSLPAYHLETRGEQYEITFEGPWAETMLWEVPALAVLMELHSRAAMARLDPFHADLVMARAKARLADKIDRLARLDGILVADFGTRRRHSFPFQDWAVAAIADGLGARFAGTSNVLLAMRQNLAPIGTNGHELPMVLAALAPDDAALAAAPYRLLEDWAEDFSGGLRVILPDTFGSPTFLARAPDGFARWPGIRIDSGDPVERGQAAIDWWRSRGEDPRQKRLVFSDGLDVDTMEALAARFVGRVGVVFGWGTLLTNDFRGLGPGDALAPFSLVCKAVAADGRPTVKLSDNPGKAIGPADEIARYRRVFATEPQLAAPVVV
jgi:nicotinate phosphoribosyltransferase